MNRNGESGVVASRLRMPRALKLEATATVMSWIW
jgi:hypothetical protein